MQVHWTVYLSSHHVTTDCAVRATQHAPTKVGVPLPYAQIHLDGGHCYDSTVVVWQLHLDTFLFIEVVLHSGVWVCFCVFLIYTTQQILWGTNASKYQEYSDQHHELPHGINNFLVRAKGFAACLG
jgi:hypothetical protein